MRRPDLTVTQVSQIIGWVSQYISTQRGVYTGGAAPIDQERREILASFFPGALLAKARVSVLNSTVSNPPFYPSLEAIGFVNLPDFSVMAAITEDVPSLVETSEEQRLAL